MNKKFSLLIFCFMLVHFVYSKSLFKLDGSIKGLFNNIYNNHNDNPLYSIEIFCDDDDGEIIDGICYIKNGKKFTIKYSGALISGGGGGPDGQGGDGSSTSLNVTEINEKEKNHDINVSWLNNYKNESEFTAKKNTLYNLNLIAKYSSYGGNGGEKPIISKQIICVDEIYYINKIPMAFGYSGILSIYKGNFDKNLSTNSSLDYKLIIESKDACVTKDDDTQYPVWYVKKGQVINFDYKRGDCYYGGIGTSGGNAETKIKINGIETTKFPETIENEMIIELWINAEGNKYKTEVLNGVVIKVDPESPELLAKLQLADGKETIQKVNSKNNNVCSNKSITITAKDKITAVKSLTAKKEFDSEIKGTSKNGEYQLVIPEKEGEYYVEANDLVGNTNTMQVIIDKKAPIIKAYYDENKTKQHSSEKWTNQNLYLKYEDSLSGIPENNNFIKFCEESGIHVIEGADNAGNIAKSIFLIDKIKPSFTVISAYESKKDGNSNNYKSCFTLNIQNILDEHSGIAEISVKAIINNENPKGIETVTIPENEKGKNSITDKTYTYELTERNINNNVKFEVTVKDVAGNKEKMTLGGENGYFVPAAIFTGYKDVEKNSVKVNFYRGNTDTALNTGNYKSIKLKRHFSLTNKDNQNVSNEISEVSFGVTKENLFNTSIMDIWKSLTAETGNLNITTNSKESYFIDTAIENTGFTHKNISYDCIYEYTDPVNLTKTVTECISNSSKLAMSNNKGRYFIRVKGEDNTYLVINDQGEIIEGSTESFKMPDTGVVKLAIKVEDPDIEPYQIQLQGYVELTSENGKFKLQETDTIPVVTKGATAGCGQTELRDDNKNKFITSDKTMNGNWVELGDYALQYNITTVFAVELTEGFTGNQEEWSNKTIRLYAKSPSVLGGKARLMVGDAGSYNADGITARPLQPIKMEIVPTAENQSLTDLFWDFGNGKTSNENDYGDYKKNSNASFENIRYEQSPDRTGALSEYKLKIRSGSDEAESAEFKVNIIDTQWGELYGDEVWRGEHIIKKEIIVPANKTLQIGDTAHLDYDSDITCLCVGKISEEEKGGITVEQKGTLIIDKGNDKTIRFVQAGFKDDKYVEAADDDKSSLNMWKGIAVKGLLKGDTLNLRDADCGLTVYPNGSIEFSDLIKIDRCKNGILMNGTSLKTKEIRLNNCSGYGIKLNSVLECEKFLLTDNGRGLVLTGNGSFKADNLEIKDCTTGIHLLGGNLILGSGKISGCREYGIKKDTDRSYTYSAFSFEGNERNIYENGIIK